MKCQRPTNFAEIINQDVRCVRHEYDKGLVSESYDADMSSTPAHSSSRDLRGGE